MSGKKIQIPVFLKIMRQSVLELLGDEESDRLFQRTGLSSLDKQGILFVLEALGDAFAQRFNSETARGLLIRAGRASLTFLRRYEEDIADLGAIDNRLKPVAKRFHYSLAELAKYFSRPCDMVVNVDLTGQMVFDWRMQADAPEGMKMDFAPYFFFGLLQEFCEWLDARKNYQLVYVSESGQETGETIIIEIREPD